MSLAIKRCQARPPRAPGSVEEVAEPCDSLWKERAIRSCSCGSFLVVGVHSFLDPSSTVWNVLRSCMGVGGWF
jgi:hypothetical protein